MFCTAAFGLSLGPFCVGLLSDTLTPLLGVEALRYALLAPICLFPVVVILLYAAAKELPHDLRMAGTRLKSDSVGDRRNRKAVAES